MPDARDWGEVRFHLMAVLDEVRADLKNASAKLAAMEIRLAVIETKAAMMGAAWGSIAGLAVAIVAAFISKKM